MVVNYFCFNKMDSYPSIIAKENIRADTFDIRPTVIAAEDHWIGLTD